MAVKTAKNGVIILEHADTVATGGNNYLIMSVVIHDPTGGSECTLYTGTSGSDPMVRLETTSAGSVSANLFGCPSTGAGLMYEDGGAGTACFVFVR